LAHLSQASPLPKGKKALTAVFALYRRLLPPLAPKGEGEKKKTSSSLGRLAQASLLPKGKKALAAVFTLYRCLFPPLATKGERGRETFSSLGPLARMACIRRIDYYSHAVTAIMVSFILNP